MANNVVPTFFATLKNDLLVDISTDVMPDAIPVLQMVESGGYEALLAPSAQASVIALSAKLEADGLKVGNDLSKQAATFLIQFFQAKIAAAVAKAQAALAPSASTTAGTTVSS